MDSQKLKVLMVEDSDIVIFSQKILLEQVGFEVEVASTGLAGVEQASLQRYNLITVDLGLPDIDGIEVAKRIKSSGKNTTTPIISITAQHDSIKANECLAAGVSRVFNKPLRLSVCDKIWEFTYHKTQLLSAV